MAKQVIKYGDFVGDTNPATTELARESFRKSKENFDELYARATGDMNKSTYDADNSGAVDAADKVTGVDAAGNVTYYGKDAAGNIGFHSFALDKVDAYADFASFPVAGFDDVIYIDKSAFVLYLWDDVNTIYKAVAGGVSQGYVDAKVEDQIVDGVLDKAPSQNAVFDALALKVDDSQVLTDVPAGALFTDTVYNDTAIQADVDSKVKKRTIKTITTTVSYTLIAADFTDFVLKFTANANEEISIILNAGVAPLDGELQMISTGNNKLVPSLTGVTATYPEQTNPKTILKGWLGGIVTATDTISFNGSLESTATSGIADAPSDGTAYNRKDAAWVVAVDTDTTYAPFTNTVNGLVPAPNVSGGTTYTVDITSPAEGATVTEGQVTSVTIDLPAGVVSTAEKFLKDDGWVDPIQILKYLVPLFSSGNETDTTLPSYAAFKEYYNRVFNFKGSTVGTWTLPNVADQFGVKIRVVNESNFTLTLNTNGGSAIIWNKNAMVNTIDLLAGETIEFECDATWYFITNKY